MLARYHKTINWIFGIGNKIVNTTTDNGSNFVESFNVFGEAAERVEEESPNEERSNCSSGNDDEDTIQPVQLLPILKGDNNEEDVEIFLPKHMSCALHTLNFVATTDAGKTLNKCAIYKKYYRSAFAKGQELWYEQSWSSKALNVTKDNIGFLLQNPTAIRWNSVNDAVGRLIAIFDNRDNLNAFYRACTILTLPLFTSNDTAFFKEYHRVMRPICTALENLQSEEYAYTKIFWSTLFINEKNFVNFKRAIMLRFACR